MLRAAFASNRVAAAALCRRGAKRGAKGAQELAALERRRADLGIDPSAPCDATLAALVERLPVLTPELPAWQAEHVEQRHELAAASAKVYPSQLTEAEEAPDTRQARLRVDAIIKAEGQREGAGDREGDERTTDRRLAQRLFLLLRVDGEWRFPQARWAAPASAQECLEEEVSASCGEALELSWVGHAPLAHLEQPGERTFWWKAQLLGGEVVPAAGIDFAWLTREELDERLAGADPELRRLTAEMCGPFA